MTKKELLMAAAKAYWGDEIDDVCSIEWSEQDDAVLYTHGDNQDHNGRDRTYRWDPLEEDADALQLAMKLRLSIVHESERVYGEKVPTVEVIGPERRNGSRHCEMHSLDDDPMAAVRRCITRAAAAAALAVSDLAKEAK